MKMFGFGLTPAFSESSQRHSWQTTGLFSSSLVDQNFPNVRQIYSQIFSSQFGVEVPGFSLAPSVTPDRREPVCSGEEDDAEDLPALPPKTSVVCFFMKIGFSSMSC